MRTSGDTAFPWSPSGSHDTPPFAHRPLFRKGPEVGMKIPELYQITSGSLSVGSTLPIPSAKAVAAASMQVAAVIESCAVVVSAFIIIAS
jgi:hypothetical protein